MELHYQTHDRTISKVGYQVRLSAEPIEPEWDAFVSRLPHGHHVQTSLWGQAKQVLGYRTVRIIASENGRIVAGGQLLVRRIMPLVSIAYMPKGPLLPTWDPVLARTIVDALKREARRSRFLVVAIQPPNHDPESETFLANHGFRPSWLELVPTATILIDLRDNTDKLLRQMKRQTRQNVRRRKRTNGGYNNGRYPPRDVRRGFPA